ncbi:MAG: ABC transporter permease [Euryarchaeota archaeon]|nr:ABC transporter permease [Euryarchaeota archaeon]
MNVQAVFGRSLPRVIGAYREPSWIFFETVLPILGIAAYVYIYKAMGAPDYYMGYVIIGGAMTAYWLNVLWSMAAQFYWEKEMGNLELYMMAPISRMSILGGMALGGMFATTVRAVSTIIIGLVIFNVTFVIVDHILLVLVFAFTIFALYGMGMMFASLYMLWGREAWHTSNLLTEPIYLVSGFYFPVKYFGFFMAAAASFIPITLGLDGMRQTLFANVNTGFLPVWMELVVLIVLSLVFIVLAKYMLAYMEKLGKREGRLTMRWQ